MAFEDTFVKLLPNASVKRLLEESKEANHPIDIKDSYFIVRDNKSCQVSFKGMKIRDNVWGITFSKSHWPNGFDTRPVT